MTALKLQRGRVYRSTTARGEHARPQPPQSSLFVQFAPRASAGCLLPRYPRAAFVSVPASLSDHAFWYVLNHAAAVCDFSINLSAALAHSFGAYRLAPISFTRERASSKCNDGFSFSNSTMASPADEPAEGASGCSKYCSIVCMVLLLCTTESSPLSWRTRLIRTAVLSISQSPAWEFGIKTTVEWKPNSCRSWIATAFRCGFNKTKEIDINSMKHFQATVNGIPNSHSGVNCGTNSEKINRLPNADVNHRVSVVAMTGRSLQEKTSLSLPSLAFCFPLGNVITPSSFRTSRSVLLLNP